MDQQQVAALISAVWRRAADSVTHLAAGATPASLFGRVAPAVAVSAYGVKESPSGSNDGPWVRPYLSTMGARPGAWCAYAAFATWKRSVDLLNTLLGEGTYELANKTSGGSVRAWHKNREQGYAIRYDEINPHEDYLGWIWIRVRDEKDRESALEEAYPGHTGIVLGTNEKTIFTWEGNTDARGQSANGGGVFIKTIDFKDPRLVGLIRPVLK